jgi:hypothetical protein
VQPVFDEHHLWECGITSNRIEGYSFTMNRKTWERVSSMSNYPVHSHESYNMDFGSCDNVATLLTVPGASLQKASWIHYSQMTS